ncbi:MAG: hypothetical protein K6G89_02445 [Clostridia bacterium]|nr:hypothetical protein [Clostridia bacterium]
MAKKVLLNLFPIMLCCAVVVSLCSCTGGKGELLLSGISDSGLIPITYKNDIELSTKRYEDPRLVETTYRINIYGKEYMGSYEETCIFPYHKCAVDRYRVIEDGRYTLSFCINRYSKKLSSFRFSIDDFSCETNKDSGKSREECRQIAIQKLYEYDSEIVFTEKYPQDNYLKDIYKFMFVRTIDGIETSDIYSVKVNTDGVIVGFNSDSMPSFENLGSKLERLKNIDESDLNEQIEDKLSVILEGKNYEKWELIRRTLHILKDGSPCIEYGIRVVFGTYEVEVEGSIEKAEDYVYLRFIKML